MPLGKFVRKSGESKFWMEAVCYRNVTAWHLIEAFSHLFFKFRLRPSSRAENSDLIFRKITIWVYRFTTASKNLFTGLIQGRKINYEVKNSYWISLLLTGKSCKIAWSSPKIKISSTFAKKVFQIQSWKTIGMAHSK